RCNRVPSVTLRVGQVRPVAFPAAGGWQAAAASRTGAQRQANEDRWLVVPAAGARPLRLAVADGVGGEAAGERASAAGIESLQQSWQRWHLDAPPGESEVRRRLHDAARDADLAVRHLAKRDPRCARAATTLTAAAV